MSKRIQYGLSSVVLAAAFMSAVTVQAAPRDVRIASHVSELSPLHMQSQMFAAEINKRLPGQFNFKLFPGGQLGKEKALINNVRAGSLEMINVASSVLKLDKKLGIFDLPWLFTDRDHVKRAMMGKLGAEVAARIEKQGVVVIGMYENGFRHVINKMRAIKTPADIKGMKIRISGGKFRQGVFASMGAIPTKVAWGEAFTAMQTGVVDGAEAAAYGFYEQKHYEVQKFLCLTSHVYTPSFMLASKSFWGSLSAEQQKVFKAVGQEITAAAYDKSAALEKKYFGIMKTKLAINAVDLPAFQKATRPVYKSYIDSQGDDWVKLVEATR
jgi:TRAP-type transport system periplasmic protein